MVCEKDIYSSVNYTLHCRAWFVKKNILYISANIKIYMLIHHGIAIAIGDSSRQTSESHYVAYPEGVRQFSWTPSSSPNCFIFMESFWKIWINQSYRTWHLGEYESPTQTFWIRPWSVSRVILPDYCLLFTHHHHDNHHFHHYHHHLHHHYLHVSISSCGYRGSLIRFTASE